MLLAARGPQRELSTSHEAAVTAVLRREKVMDVVSKRWREEGRAILSMGKHEKVMREQQHIPPQSKVGPDITSHIHAHSLSPSSSLLCQPKQVLPLLAPSFSLPYPTRRDVHLDYAPSLRAMQEADVIQNAGGRVSRRKKTYFTKVVEFERVDEFREGLATLARTGLAK